MSGMTSLKTYIGLTPIQGAQISKHFYAYLVDRAKERHSKNEHIVYSSFPDIRHIRTMIYWGVFSWSIPKYRERWLIKSAAVDVEGYASTPGDIVRDYLDYWHPRPLRCIGAEARMYQTPMSAPLYSTAHTIQNGTYIDISSAYFSIVKMVGWNINYLSEMWVIAGRAPIDFPLADHKGARNYLVSIGRPTPMLIWNGYEFKQKTARNVHTNLGLWHLVMEILHSIAAYAIACSAQYVHTDGYIIPTENVGYLLNYIESFGLSARVLGQGEAYVFGIGNYSVGDKRSKSFDPKRRGKDINYVQPSNPEWLKSQIQEIDRRRVAYVLYRQSVKRDNSLKAVEPSSKLTEG